MNEQVTPEERLTEARFLKDVAQHAMAIIRDDGVHRHLRFARPGTGCMHFDIVTYPNYLVYSGDMGCYVFSRLHDMFEFFRVRPRNDEPGRLHINLGYWAEKLEATDRPDGHKEYSADQFRKYVAYRLEGIKEEFAEDYEADQEDTSKFDALKEAVDEDVLAYADDGDFQAHQVLDQFEHDGRRWFPDSWEARFDQYTFRFVWCCYALAWSIQQYDAAKAKAAA